MENCREIAISDFGFRSTFKERRVCKAALRGLLDCTTLASITHDYHQFAAVRLQFLIGVQVGIRLEINPIKKCVVVFCVGSFPLTDFGQCLGWFG